MTVRTATAITQAITATEVVVMLTTEFTQTAEVQVVTTTTM